ncbi:MAG: hypothetical protein R2813_02745 [Flavobacteriales bacterium]
MLLLPRALQELLLPNRLIKKSESDQYAYYEKVVKNGIKNTKWEKDIEQFLKTGQGFGLSYSGKSILDISGGPGFRGKQLTELGAHVCVTEFNAEASAAMARALDLDVRKFDYANDFIHEVFMDKVFDLVIVRFSIGYCDNLSEFIDSLKKRLNPKAQVMISFPEPSVPYFIRHQLQEYNYSTLHSCQAIKSAFQEKGFTIQAEKNNKRELFEDYPRRPNQPSYKRLLLSWTRDYLGKKYLQKNFAGPNQVAKSTLENYDLILQLN